MASEEGEYEARLFGTPGEARQLLEQNGFIVLDEGHHKLALENGAELSVYASLHTRTPQIQGGRAPPGEKPLNKRYGFSNGVDRDISSLWRKDFSDDQGSVGRRDAYPFGNAGIHRDMNTWGWGQK